MKDLQKRYRLGLDAMGLGLFVLIMLPNVIWAAVPPVPDPLSLPSVTPRLDSAASAAQALMVAALCLVKSRQTVPVPRPAAAAIGLCCLGYYAAWGCYYGGCAASGAVSIHVCAALLGPAVVCCGPAKLGSLCARGGVLGAAWGLWDLQFSALIA